MRVPLLYLNGEDGRGLGAFTVVEERHGAEVDARHRRDEDLRTIHTKRDMKLSDFGN